MAKDKKKRSVLDKMLGKNKDVETPEKKTTETPSPGATEQPPAEVDTKDEVLFEIKLKSREKRYALLRFSKRSDGKYAWAVVSLGNHEPISESQDYVNLEDAKENASSILVGWQLLNGLTVRSYLDRV